MNKIEKQNAIDVFTSRCLDEMRKAGKDNDEAHKLILDKYEALVKPLGLSRIAFMVECGRASGALTNYREIYG